MALSKETKELIKAAKAASIKAQREASALDLVVRLISNGVIYDKYPDGHMEQIGSVPKIAGPKLKKGTVLKFKE